MTTDVLKDIAGIHARRLWDAGMQASDAATLAAEAALLDAGVDRASRSACWSTPRSAATASSRRPRASSAATSACPRTARTSTSPMPAWPSSTAWTSPGACSNAARSTTRWSSTAKPPTSSTRRPSSACRVPTSPRTEFRERIRLAHPGLRRRRDGHGARANWCPTRRATRAASRARRPSGTRCAAATSTAWSPTPGMLLIEGLKLAQKTFAAAKLGAGLGGRRDRPVRHPPGQPRAHRGVHQDARHRPEEGH